MMAKYSLIRNFEYLFWTENYMLQIIMFLGENDTFIDKRRFKQHIERHIERHIE